MKLVLIGLLAFVIGVGGGVGAAFLRPSPEAPPAADSTQVAHAPADSSATPAAHPAAPSHATSAEPDAHAAPAARAAATATRIAPPTPPTAAPPTALASGAADSGRVHTAPTPRRDREPDPEPPPESYGQIARILSKMKTADAAAIMVHLDDHQVEEILLQLGVRQAAALMSAMPSARAAMLSRRIIRHPDPVASETR